MGKKSKPTCFYSQRMHLFKSKQQQQKQQMPIFLNEVLNVDSLRLTDELSD